MSTVFAHSKDKEPTRRILLLKLGIQIQVFEGAKLPNSRRLSTGYFSALLPSKRKHL
jgi:hypothetical protein